MGSVNEARNIFKVLDSENNGFITVENFIAAFNNFYKVCNNDDNEQNNLKSLINQMKPDSEGKIYFDNFNVVFQQLDSEKNHELKSKKHEKYSIRRFLSAEVNDSSDEDNSDVDRGLDFSERFNGLQTSQEMRSPGAPSTHSEYKLPQINLNVSPSLLPSAASRARELLSAGASPRESEAHSEILYHEIGNNFDFLQMQMRRLEEKIESFHSNQNDVDGKQSKRLKEENSVLTRRINNLEDSLRELEERAENRISEEKKDIKLRLTRTEDEKKLEVESLLTRIFKLEAESADISLEIRQYKDESEKLKAEKHSLTETLAESDTRLNILQENLEQFRKQSKLDVEALKKERDGYEKIIKELEEKANFTSFESNTREVGELSSRHKELEILVNKLKEENRQLSLQLEETHKDMLQKGIRDGEEILKMNDELYSELEHNSKEELMDILVKEKDANKKVKDYIEKIIVKVMEKHPSLLEVAVSPR